MALRPSYARTSNVKSQLHHAYLHFPAGLAALFSFVGTTPPLQPGLLVPQFSAIVGIKPLHFWPLLMSPSR